MKQIQPVLLASVIGFLLFSAQAKADLLVVDSHSPKKVETEKKIQSSAPSNLIIKDSYQEGPVEQKTVKTLPAPVATQASRLEPVPVVASIASARQQGRLLMVGSPSPSPALKGWADDVPLSLALGQVVPSGFKVVKKDGFTDDRLVSWKGGKSWNSVLSSLTFGYKFDAKIDWINQVVEIGPIGSIQPTPVASKEITTVVDLPSVEAQRPVTVVARPPVVAPMPMVKSFATIPGRSLRENIEAWAEKESKNTGLTWTVVWEGADYPVVASATFNGDFNDPAGPIATIIAAYDDSDQPLIAELTLKDRVIHVKNRNYTPASVLLSSPSELAPNSFVR